MTDLALPGYIAIASVMVVFSLVLAPTVCRWLNIVSTLYIVSIVSIVASAIGEAAYFVLLSIVEVAFLLVLFWYA